MKHTIPRSITCALATCEPAGTQEAPGPFLIVTVETGGYNFSSVYRQPTHNQSEILTIAPYRAVIHVHVRADDMDLVGGLIDVVNTAGRTRRAGRARQRHHPVAVADAVARSPGVLPA